jgi:hypothetical protein
VRVPVQQLAEIVGLDVFRLAEEHAFSGLKAREFAACMCLTYGSTVLLRVLSEIAGEMNYAPPGGGRSSDLQDWYPPTFCSYRRNRRRKRVPR